MHIRGRIAAGGIGRGACARERRAGGSAEAVDRGRAGEQPGEQGDDDAPAHGRSTLYEVAQLVNVAVASPKQTSLPVPPASVSLPAPPTIQSVPPPALILS